MPGFYERLGLGVEGLAPRVLESFRSRCRGKESGGFRKVGTLI